MLDKDIKIVRLISGEELISEIHTRPENQLELKNPVRIVVVPDKNNPNQPQIAFAPWVEFTKDESIILDWDHVLFTATPIQQFVEHYKATFSKVILPTSSLILPQK